MNQNRLISIITTVYNAEKYLHELISSIIDQTYSNFEFIVVDDCSTDNSYSILKKYQKQDSRIKLIKNEHNHKQAYSRNLAINMANGKYIAFIDADDIAHLNRLQIQLNFIEQNPDVDVCGSYYYLFNGNNFKFKQTPPITHDEIECHMRLFGNCIAFPSVMLKTDIIKEFMFNEKMLGNAEDYELWIRMLDNNVKFYNIPEYLLYYRIHNSQSSQLNLKPIYEYVNNIRSKTLKKIFPDWSAHKITNALSAMMNSKLNVKLLSYYVLLNQIVKANFDAPQFNSSILKKTIRRVSIRKRLYLKLLHLFLKATDKK